MRIRHRIVSVVLLLLILMLIALAFSLKEISRLGRELERVSNTFIPLSEAVSSVSTGQVKQALAFEREMFFSSEIPMTVALPGDGDFAKSGRSVEASFRRADFLLGTAIRENKFAAYEGLLLRLQARLQDAKAAYNRYVSQAANLLIQKAKLPPSTLMERVFDLAVEESDLRIAVTAILEEIMIATRGASVRATHAQLEAQERILLIGGASLVIGLTLAFFITASIATPLAIAQRVANEIGQGNRNVSIPTDEQGEVGQLLLAMKEMQNAVLHSEQALAAHASELSRSNSELEKFAYIASHDLQEPLRMVTSYLELLEKRYKSKLDPQADEFIHFAVDGAKRMRELINVLLSYARIGRSNVPHADLPLAQIVERATFNLSSLIEESKATVDVGELPVVHGEETMLLQLFQNLLSNSIRFRSDVPPVIQIRSQIIDSRKARITVSDNGIGIATEHHHLLFQLFSRVPTGRAREGHGLGLAICKKIVELHGGEISVDASEKRGTTFVFTLPLSDVVAPEESH